MLLVRVSIDHVIQKGPVLDGSAGGQSRQEISCAAVVTPERGGKNSAREAKLRAAVVYPGEHREKNEVLAIIKKG